MNKGSPLLKTGLFLLLSLALVAVSSCQSRTTPQPQAAAPQPAQPAQEVSAVTPAPPTTPTRAEPAPPAPPLPTAPKPSGPPKLKIAFVATTSGNADIFTMDADGKGDFRRLTSHAAADVHPAFSPDGKKIAFTSNRSGNWDVFVMNADGTRMVNLTNNPATDATPSWSPDGKRIAFASDREAQMKIWVMNADGTGATAVSRHPQPDYYPMWSPAGDEIAFFSTHPRTGNQGVFLMDTQGSVLSTMALIVPIEWSASRLNFPAAWAPDGSKIAFADANLGSMMNGIYTGNRDGSNRVLLWEVPTSASQSTGARIRYSIHIGSLAWAADGKKIAFGSTHDGISEKIYVVNSDGSGLMNITHSSFLSGGMPNFQPVR